MTRISILTAMALVLLGCGQVADTHGDPVSLGQSESLSVGVAKIEITPEEPIRMSGYGSRNVLSSGVAAPLFAKALAFGDDDRATLLVTADLVGVPGWLTREVAARLGIPAERLAICATHTHSGPQLRGLLVPIFMEDIPGEEMAAIDRYSDALVDKIESVCRAALANRRPSRLEWGIGEVGFASNRRVLENGKWTGFGVQADGPVDHSLPVMRIADDQDRLSALLVNYACHCTTLGGDFHEIHGDWAGEAQRLIEERHPGVTALIAIGCGADANPNPRGSMESVLQNGKTLADEVDRVIGARLKRIRQGPSTRVDRIALPLDPLPSRESWETLAASSEKTAYYGKLILERLNRGESLPTSIDYPIQTWTFGTDLAMVFLPGEVVVDYSIKLKELFDAEKIWINAYANEAPSYIASRRLYYEGGYEVDRSMYYYDKPTRLAPETEELVLDEVLKQLPYPFYSKRTLGRIPAPVPKEEALSTIRAHPDVKVELAAAEPLVMDPIDIAWGPDGRMWVVEMADYPLGLDGNGQPGGRIRFLEDEDGDGIYDRSTLFIEALNFPTSVLPWRDGVLITAAPDILFARDTDGDGRADDVESLYTGFRIGNQQHLVNGLQWGLDGWIYLANGDSGGMIRSTSSEEMININGRDLRIHPEDGGIEAVQGRSQFGRNRDGWGNWFGNSNSWPGWHYALDDGYLRRNPHVTYTNGIQYLPEVPQAGPVYPVSATLSRYNDYEKSNRFTSASGFMIYEDDALGEAFAGNSFVAESVHNLVSRGIVYPKGATFASRRASDETGAEFLASTDNWFRPTAIRSGPDGTLYIVDMYRLVIEHPEWVPPDWQRKLDLREGHDKGRIFRVSGKEGSATKPPRLDELSSVELVRAFDTTNRWQRDQIHQLLVWKPAPEATESLRAIVNNGKVPQARSQALWILSQLDALDEMTLLAGLDDTVAGVRRQAVRLSESRLDANTELLDRVLALANDNDPQVRMQVAYALGESRSDEAGRALARMALAGRADPLMLAAVLSSAISHQEILAELCGPELLDAESRSLLRGLLQTSIGSKNPDVLNRMITPLLDSKKSVVRLEAFAEFNQVLADSGSSLDNLHKEASEPLRSTLEKARSLFSEARELALDTEASIASRKISLRVLAFDTRGARDTASSVAELLSPKSPTELQLSAVDSMENLLGSDSAGILLRGWNGYGPSLRRKIINTLLAKRESTIQLLRAAENDAEIVSAFTTVQIAMITRDRDARVHALASRIFDKNVTSNRAKLVEDYHPALDLKGDPQTGKNLYVALCSACHRFWDIGFDVGPDLASLSMKSPFTMLEAILDPNRAVEDKYAQYTATSLDGRTAIGILAEENATSLTLVNAGGLKQTVLRRNLKTLESGASLMPEGLEAGLNRQQMADLIAYIGATDGALKILPDPDGSVGLTASRGTSKGPSVYYDADSEIFEWVADTDTLQWTVHDLKAGYYAIFSDAALAVEYEGRPFTLTLNDTFVTGTISTTGGLDRFRKRKFGNIEIESDIAVAKFQLRHQLEGPQLSLKELRLIPVPTSSN